MDPELNSSRTRIVFFLFLAIALFFLLTEHRAHVFGLLPYLLVLACPLMHLFHHGSHGGHQGSHHVARGEKPGPPVTRPSRQAEKGPS